MIMGQNGPHLAVLAHDHGNSPGEVRFLKFWHWAEGRGQTRHTLGTA